MKVPSGIFLDPANTPIKGQLIKKGNRKGARLRTPTFRFGLSDINGNFTTMLDNLEMNYKRSDLKRERKNKRKK
jgi:hypothetical protein